MSMNRRNNPRQKVAEKISISSNFILTGIHQKRSTEDNNLKQISFQIINEDNQSEQILFDINELDQIDDSLTIEDFNGYNDQLSGI